jgi:predicted SprT family Zn-dependent metalloprotease
LDKLKAIDVMGVYMKECGLKDFSKDNYWSLRFSNHTVMAGVCYMQKKQIALSKYYVENNPEVEVRNTMLHEIAHAISPSCEHHGYVWRKNFKDLLIKFKQPIKVSRCYNSQEVKMPKGKYKITCEICNATWSQHHQTKKIRNAFANKGYMLNRWHKDCGMKSKDKLKVTKEG